MKKIAIICFEEDADVYRGVDRLIERYPDAHIMVAVSGDNIFLRTAMPAIIYEAESYMFYVSETEGLEEVPTDKVTICANPVKEVIREIQADDVLALVWDDSLENHAVLHSVEDYGLEIWDISHGLDPIEMDYDDSENTDDLYETMVTTLTLFAETLAAYVVSSVLDVLTETVMRRLEEGDGMRDVSPFDDDL